MLLEDTERIASRRPVVVNAAGCGELVRSTKTCSLLIQITEPAKSMNTRSFSIARRPASAACRRCSCGAFETGLSVVGVGLNVRAPAGAQHRLERHLIPVDLLVVQHAHRRGHRSDERSVLDPSVALGVVYRVRLGLAQREVQLDNAARGAATIISGVGLTCGYS
jgi:hypothetical protein